jgi:hypothetical protein
LLRLIQEFPQAFPLRQVLQQAAFQIVASVLRPSARRRSQVDAV